MEEMRWFRKRGHDLMLISPIHSKLAEHAANHGFRFKHLSFTKAKLVSEIWRMYSIIREFNPDVLATHSSVDSWVALVAGTLRRIPCRVRYRHVSTHVKGHLLNKLQYRSLSNLILTTGECIRKPLIKTFCLPRGKVFSVPTAVKPPDVILSKNEARNKLQAELGLGSETRFVGQVSVLRSWKGHFTLINAFAKVATEFPDFHLVFVGSGPIEKRITEELKYHPLKNRIHLVGHKTDPWPYFRAFEVAILASLSNEGIPQSLLQAMYVQTPVVGTNVGGIPEILFHNKTGLLVKPGDPDLLAQAVCQLLKDANMQARFSSNSHNLVKDAFNWADLGTRIEKLFNQRIKSRKQVVDINEGFSPVQCCGPVHLNLGLKRKVLLFAQHSSWGAASNFSEMFNASGEYDSWELLHDLGGSRGYEFGDRMKERKVLTSDYMKIRNLLSDPDAIIFIFDYNGLKLFERCMRKMKLFYGLPINAFWTGNPYIKHHEFCNKWAKKFNVRAYAMLDLLRFSDDSLPLMQPYDTSTLAKPRQLERSTANNFVICHSPGHKGSGNEKGTQMIQSVISEVQQEHKEVLYKQLGGETWLSHRECIMQKAYSDVFIDKIGLHSAGGIGKSGIEAICLGIPTICATHNSTFRGRYKNLKILVGNTEQELKKQIFGLSRDQEYLGQAKENVIRGAKLFDYDTTLDYLEKTMSA